MMGGDHDFRILIADDERPILNAYRRIFTEETSQNELEAELFGGEAEPPALPEFDVAYFQQGEEAVAAVRQACNDGRPFAVAFLDMRMPPGIDGVEVAKQIRGIDPEINIVVVTGFSDLHPREIAARVPPVEKLYYVAKPFQVMEIQQFALALTRKWAAEQALLAAHQALQHRFDDLQRAYGEMSSLRDQAEQASRAKTEFLARMSHELRTPLNAIIGFSEMMMDQHLGQRSPDSYLKYSRDIHSSGRHLLNLINDILDLSKIESGKFEVDNRLVDVPELVAWIRRLIEPAAEDKGLAFEVQAGDELPNVYSDWHRLAQVLLNLLGNAVKFTPAGGKVTLTITTEGSDGLCFEIADSGIGIAAGDLDRVQQPFEQADSGHSREFEGAGLGLPLAKWLIIQLGGRFAIASTLGQGTRVTLALPARRPSPSEGPASEDGELGATAKVVPFSARS